jgi:hypothetical protein
MILDGWIFDRCPWNVRPETETGRLRGWRMVVPEFSSSNHRGCGYSDWSRGRAETVVWISLIMQHCPQNRRGGEWSAAWRRVQDTSIDRFGQPTPDALPTPKSMFV